MRTGVLASLGAAVLLSALVAAQSVDGQMADPDFKPSADPPSYVTTHPRVVLDEAHANFHTVTGRYQPFAAVLRADGYRVDAGTQPFTAQTLAEVGVLVVANALGAGFNGGGPTPPPSAFTPDECDAVRDWVRGGGALLLIADHAPFGATAATLAERFGVEMGKGYAWTTTPGNPEPTTTLTFSRQNGLLGSHPITRGIDRIVAFTGQSLSVPAGATALLEFDPAAHESSLASAEADLAAARAGKPTSARPLAGRAQGLALEYGKGRVVMTGEAAMFSAQVIRYTDQGRPAELKMGMNVPGNDNQRFLRQILHWLSRLDS